MEFDTIFIMSSLGYIVFIVFYSVAKVDLKQFDLKFAVFYEPKMI
jgi:hypothetical protein